MKIALIGVGQAGGKVVDALLAYERRSRTSFVTDSLAVNTARADLYGLENVPTDRRVLVGQARVKGHGVGADNELGAEVAVEDLDEVLSAVDSISAHEVDAFLIVAGLGGGTGSGAAPVIARGLKRIYTEPVYGLGILPARDEGGIYNLNAARSFLTFVREVDNLIVFDNDAWRHSGESVGESYATMNEELARRLGVLFSAGEVTEGQAVGESVVDASEVINTLASGGVSTIGYASARVAAPSKRGLFGRSKRTGDESGGDATNRVVSLVRRATLGRLTLPCEVNATERALVVVSGRSENLSRRGIERARKWIEEATGTMEVRGGDYPIDSEHVAAVVLLSGVTNVPRIKELQAIAVEAQQGRAEREAEAPAALSDLLNTDEELSSLF